ncbi:YqgE/AlgH family protein [Propioniciclava soli]|uniref:YqgE/AlgH family protein n=1 Tax=Propioniciclava soli TaxID=2775081 RepID=A0ABZ3CDY4_9ACTN
MSLVDADNPGPAIRPGTLLVAGVMVGDGLFDGAVVLLLDVDGDGALGVILNRLSDFDLERALPGWERLVSFPHRLHDGGPVSPDGAIALASPADAAEEPPGWRELFATVGLLHLQTPLELADGAFRDLRIFAGYTGWGPGQLAGEIADDLWLVVPATYSDVFDPDPQTLWRRVLARQEGELGWLSTWTSTPELN